MPTITLTPMSDADFEAELRKEFGNDADSVIAVAHRFAELTGKSFAQAAVLALQAGHASLTGFINQAIDRDTAPHSKKALPS